MKRQLRITVAILLAGSAGGAATVFGASNPFNAPAAVTRPAVRLKVPATTTSPSEPAIVNELVALVNAERAGRGLPTLAWRDSLWAAANGHSIEMAANGVLRHQGDNGSNGGDRITAAGFNWSAWGENLGAGYSNPGLLLTGWLNSPPHRAVLLGAYRYIGISVVVSSTGVPYWTMVVAT